MIRIKDYITNGVPDIQRYIADSKKDLPPHTLEMQAIDRPSPKGKFVVDVKGFKFQNEFHKCTYEICLTREDAYHERYSYGWYGPCKLHISSDVHGVEMLDIVIIGLINLAEQLCEKINNHLYNQQPLE